MPDPIVSSPWDEDHNTAPKPKRVRASKAAVLTTEEQDELLSMLEEEHRDGVIEGIYTIHKGDTYPVLRWGPNRPVGKIAGMLAPGSGKIPGAQNTRDGRNFGDIARDTWYKRTNAYRELMSKAVPADLDAGRRGSLGWLLTQAFTGAEGGDFTVEHSCRHCGEKDSVTMWKKPDGKLIIQILEMVMGKAPETKDINVQTENLYKFINEEIDVRDIRVYAVAPEESAKRRAAIEAKTAEGEFRVIEEEIID